MRSESEANRAIELYGDTVYRICLLYLRNRYDADDVFQDVFLKLILYGKSFNSNAHEKAWLIRVTINACKDVLKSFFRKNSTSFDENLYVGSYHLPEQETEVLTAVAALSDNYRMVILLHYYEGYSAVEIAKILGRKVNTIYTWLDRARKDLKGALVFEGQYYS
jgi:RNA polymerase sigma-70 factor (ECF subfamily)